MLGVPAHSLAPLCKLKKALRAAEGVSIYGTQQESIKKLLTQRTEALTHGEQAKDAKDYNNDGPHTLYEKPF